MCGMVVYLLLGLLSFAILSASSPGTERVNFDFGWRFSRVNLSVHCSASAFPNNLSSVECYGLYSTGAKNADDCRDACCGESMCLIWQFSASNGCWIGASSSCSNSTEDWVGGGRNSSPVVPTPLPASKFYDDSEWEVIDVPHDGLINGTYDKSAVKSHAYLPIEQLWYRKHFNLPSDWKGQCIWIEFRGVFRASFVYFNGERLLYHDSGYTTFLVRLDNATTVNYGDGAANENVIAVEANPDQSFSGWWYEGGGIYRHTWLFTTDHVHLVVHGVYGASQVMGNITDHSPYPAPWKGVYSDVEFYPSAEIVNEYPQQVQVMVRFELFDEDNAKKGSIRSKAITIDPGNFATVNLTIPTIPKIELWSITRPYLYRLNVVLMSATDKSVIDSTNYTIGVRQTKWDSKTGFFLNGRHFTWRGFNNHNSFTGVGVAVPDRINLFRGQMMRAVGANSWRMSHNPPTPHLLDILDRIGVIVWDENRQFGESRIWMQDMRDMIKRDRNHPSVMVWSFCNEAGCSSGDQDGAAEAFTNVSKQVDPFRPVTANMNGDVGKTLSHFIDVQGFSHQSGGKFDTYHSLYPDKPLIGSECCSCRSQRGEDFTDSAKPTFASFNGNCNENLTGNQLKRGFVAGCMVWTLFDYYGEPSPYFWPMVSSSFGSIDLAGFAKPSAYWYRAWWFYRAKSNSTYSGYDVPMSPPSLVDPYASQSEENPEHSYMIHIVQSWESIEGKTNRTVQAYTNALMAELLVNGISFGKAAVNWQGWAEWSGVPFSAGKITANALDSRNIVKASHTVETAGPPAKVVAMTDVPSEKTGTGSKLVLDGQDAGMVSAAIVDAKGMVVPSSSANVTFHIVSGPGRIIGVGNGDPSCHEPNQVSWRSAYHGLARAIVQVTQDDASSSLHRKRLMQIDRDGGIRTHVVPPQGTSTADDAIVVEVSVDGLGTSSVSIPVTSDEYTHGVLAVAKRSLKK